MKTENWKNIKDVLAEALALDFSERRAFLDRADIDSETRREVESLLAFEEESENLMNLSAVEFSKDFFDQDDAEKNTLIGRRVGIYRIIGELGQGGMGAVYLAERTDGKFKQQVALKLLKREMNTHALRQRFQQEREILASLEHPNVARLLDAGTTDEAIPFLAMEYVEGLPIDDYCDEHDLDLTERLHLFRTVCQTVNFAHRNLIVHRDLKPSNILVNEQGTAKLLDFGISKILSTEEIETLNKATVTKLGVMTPSYASPEQLRGESVTTATDVYSLGVILYELLSGHRPFETKENDLKEIYRAVIDTDPLPPSAIIETVAKSFKQIPNALTEIKSAEIARPSNETAPNDYRRTAPHAVGIKPQFLRGDLDNIVLKALKKEPERRYSSAENFSEDIQRHLDGLPVAARPDTLAYRAEKFVKRNRFSVLAAALIALAIVSGIAATLWQARVASAERIKAENRFNDVRKLANSFLFEFSPKIENLPGSMPARQLLVTRALEYLDNLSQETSGDSQLQSELAKAYEKVGDVQGNPDTPNIGDLKGALQSYEKARMIRRRLSEAAPNDSDADANLANNLEVAANIDLNGGEHDRAGASLAEAVALRERVVARNPQDSDARGSLAKVLRTSGHVPFYGGEYQKSNEFYRRSSVMFEELSREFPDDPLIGYQYASTYIDFGDSLGYMDEIKSAEENIQKGLDMLIALRENHPNDNRVRRALMIALFKRGEYYRDAGDYANSLIKYDQALEMAQNALKIDPGNFQAKRDVVIANKQRAVTLSGADKTKEALKSFADAVEVSEQLKKEDPNNVLIIYDIAGSYYQMSETHYDAGDYQSAIVALQKTMDNCREVLEKNPAHTQSIRVTARSQNMLGKIYGAFAEKNGRTEMWRTALENYQASLAVYNRFKAEGKLAGFDTKTIQDLETEIGKIESKLNKS